MSPTPDPIPDADDDQTPWVPPASTAPIAPPPAAAVSSQYRLHPSTPPAAGDRSGLCSIPLLCIGLALIACCVMIPLGDSNRQLVYERERLKRDLDQIQKQVSVNQEFLKRVADDSTLAQRLAQRQMKLLRDGTSVLELKGAKGVSMSPFALVTLAPPAPMPAFQPTGGILGIFAQPRPQLYLTGAGLMLIAVGLVLGASPRTSE